MALHNSGTRKRRFSYVQVASWLFSGVALLGLMGGLVMLVGESLPVWRQSGFEFITGAKWFYRDEEFGALPMIYGSVAVAMIALVLAAPVGIFAAVFGVEFLPRRLRLGLKITVELLAGIPSVVYGLLGILILRNWVYDSLETFELLSGDTLLTAGILLAVMILPTIMTLSDDALRGVPGAQRMAARGLGLTSTETALHVSIPQAFPGLVAAVLLSLGRAMGETIAVFLVVGRQDNQLPDSLFSLQPLIEAGQTLTSKLGGSETNIAYGQPLHWAAVLGLGLILMVLVVAITFAGVWLQRFAQRRYEA